MLFTDDPCLLLFGALCRIAGLHVRVQFVQTSFYTVRTLLSSLSLLHAYPSIRAALVCLLSNICSFVHQVFRSAVCKSPCSVLPGQRYTYIHASLNSSSKKNICVGTSGTQESCIHTALRSHICGYRKYTLCTLCTWRSLALFHAHIWWRNRRKCYLCSVLGHPGGSPRSRKGERE